MLYSILSSFLTCLLCELNIFASMGGLCLLGISSLVMYVMIMEKLTLRAFWFQEYLNFRKFGSQINFKSAQSGTAIIHTNMHIYTSPSYRGSSK